MLLSSIFTVLTGEGEGGETCQSAWEKGTCPKEDTGPKPGYRYEAEHSGSMPAQLGEGPPDRSTRGPGLVGLYT